VSKYLLLPLIILLISCGNNNASKQKAGAAIFQEDTLPVEGKYRLMLRPINTHVSKIVSGNADFEARGDDLSINLYLDDAPDTSHFQTIHMGNECPLQNDENGDGLIDINEVSARSGEILLALNDKVDPAIGFQGVFPSGNSYSYEKRVSILKLEESLASEGREFKLAGKVVLIFGAPSTIELPASVATLPESSPQASLPIACGIIERVHYNEASE
jgi:hypothetical protein